MVVIVDHIIFKCPYLAKLGKLASLASSSSKKKKKIYFGNFIGL